MFKYYVQREHYRTRLFKALYIYTSSFIADPLSLIWLTMAFLFAIVRQYGWSSERKYILFRFFHV